ncbi:hypothetical protein [Pseudomonas sp. A-R-26]|uniref:hypothetical protein n=1 Tax=Pseudomonas sp. A-R-26 TaxID=2832404 RepID=UPI001CBAD1EC|nr:hypothetical protein [Pseudomonas sp. A-R-26]
MYIFKNTERNNYKASQYETKSLLYLIGLRSDRKQISILAIDCFNDVTGLSAGGKLWDLQSKGEAGLTPQKIGKYLYTLYSNYDSKFEFYEFIFFMPMLKGSYLKGDVGYFYNFDNFKDVEKDKVILGLSKELTRVHCVVNRSKIDSFLERVVFVEDRELPHDYVKNVLDFKGKNKKSDSFYDEIFKEIRDRQVIKKASYIEGLSISRPLDVLSLNRHIETKDIHVLLVNRFVGIDLFSQQGIPIEFYSEATARHLDVEDLRDLIQDCQAKISRAFFNKNSKREFWKVLEVILNSVEENRSVSISDIFKDVELLVKRLTVLDRDSVLFLSALIKEGLSR